MKTTKYFPAISLILLFAGVTAVFSGNRPTSSSSGQYIKQSIRYEVRIHLDRHFESCNKYLVQVTDENGRTVAEPQRFVPGTSNYNFLEAPSAVPGKVRIASLVLYTNSYNPDCANLSTKSKVKLGPFIQGQVYSFDLWPREDD
jgi:hypothetical protein